MEKNPQNVIEIVECRFKRIPHFRKKGITKMKILSQR